MKATFSFLLVLMIALVGGCEVEKRVEGCEALQPLRLGIGTNPKIACQHDSCLVAWDSSQGVQGALINEFGQVLSQQQLPVQGKLIGVALEWNGGFSVVTTAGEGDALTEWYSAFSSDLSSVEVYEENPVTIRTIGTIQQYLVGTSAEGIIFREMGQGVRPSTPVVLFSQPDAELFSMAWVPGSLAVFLKANGKAQMVIYSGLVHGMQLYSYNGERPPLKKVELAIDEASGASEPIVVTGNGENFTAFWQRDDGSRRTATFTFDGTILESGATDIPLWTRRLAKIAGGFAGVTAAEGLVKSWALDSEALMLDDSLAAATPADILGGQTSETYAFTTPSGFARILTPIATQCGGAVCVDLASTACAQ
jgi:hypothetical protein